MQMTRSCPLGYFNSDKQQKHLLLQDLPVGNTIRKHSPFYSSALNYQVLTLTQKS